MILVKKDSAVIDILSNPNLFSLFNMLKTSNWRNLSEKNKEIFFEKLNRAVCISLKIAKLQVEVGDGELNEDNFLSTSDYSNVIIDADGGLVINDVNYNQYLTVFEYLIKLRIHLLQLSYTGEYNGYFDDEDMKKAISTYLNSYESVLDSPGGIVNNYVTSEYLGFDLIDERTNNIQKVTKEMIINFAKKIHLDTIFLLQGGDSNEEEI